MANASTVDLQNCRDSLDYLVHFLFDDTSLAEDAHSTIGWILESEEEAACVKDLVAATNNFLEAFPEDVTPERAFTDPLWKEVRDRSLAVSSLIARS